MMNPTEFKEFVEVAVLSKCVVMLWNGEDGAGRFEGTEYIARLVNDAFEVECSTMGLYENGSGDRVGAIHLVTEYNEKKGCACIDIYDYTDKQEIEDMVKQSERYQTT